MSELRTRMIRDMTLRGFSPRTHEAYIRAVVGLAKHSRRPPDQLTHEDVQVYLAHLLQDRTLAWSSCSQAAHAFRFLYHVTLGHDRAQFHVPAPRQPQKLPEILSREEVWRLLNACPRVRDRLLLATTYAAGLRVSEVVHLKVSDLDADRMTVRIEPGKGARDRYVPLSPRLLTEWRAYWPTTPPRQWLFPNRAGPRPIDITVAQKLYTLTKLRAGIRKQGGIHARRHAFATHLLEAGQDVHTVPRVLGHRYVSSPVRYFHLSQGRVLATPSPWTCRSRPPPEPWPRWRRPAWARPPSAGAGSSWPISSAPTARPLGARTSSPALRAAPCAPSKSAARPCSAATGPCAPPAAASASPTTLVATGTARNASGWPPSAGSSPAGATCCRSRTSTSSSRCPMRSTPSPRATRA